MDREEIRYLLGEEVLAHASKLEDKVRDLQEETSGRGVRHLSALVRSGGQSCRAQCWLRANGTFVSASCPCARNENGDGPCCEHIGALLLAAYRMEQQKAGALEDPAEQRRQQLLRDKVDKGSNYTNNLAMLFGKKWREDEPESDLAARQLLEVYQQEALAELESPLPLQRQGFARLEPELTLLSSSEPWLRLRVSDGEGRGYLVKSIPELLQAVEQGQMVSYSKNLCFVHQWSAFEPRAQQILTLLRRQQSARQGMEARTGRLPQGLPAGGVFLSGEAMDSLVELCAPEGVVGGYTLAMGMPPLTLTAAPRRGGVQVGICPVLGWAPSLEGAYVFDETTLWKLERTEAARLGPALRALCGQELFFSKRDAVDFCSYVLPALGRRVQIQDPERLLLDQIPLEPVVQFYLDSPHGGTVSAHAEFLYGEDKVTQDAAPLNLVRDSRAESRAQRLLSAFLEKGYGPDGREYGAADEETVCRFLDEGVPALLTMGEVYLSDAFRRLEATPPKVSVGVSVHGSVLDLEVDTGEFPVGELRGLIRSLRQKKRYHRLRDGSLLRLDDSMQVLEELDETLELSGAKLTQGHAQLPLYRAPSLDGALSGRPGVRFSRDDAFRRISRSFHAVKDSDYAPPESLRGVLRKYQRDGYRWLRTLDGYGMGGILADDMGLGKTLQVLSYLLALKEGGQTLPSLIVCPASLVLNWAQECEKFTPQLRCIAVDGDAAHRAALAQQWAEADLVVTGYELLRRDEALYAQQPFYACILDEAQAIKNHTTQKYKAVCRVRSQVRFALTGTPVENRLGELWSIFSFLMPGYLPPYMSFCNRFEKPILQQEDKEAARRLNLLTSPFILRRMKSEVLRELPPKTETVCRVEMEEQQRRLYLAAVLDSKDKLRAAKPEDRMAVFAVLTRLRELCCDPRLVTEDWAGGSAKLEACMELVQSAVEGGHRILLFSQFTSMLELLASRLDEAGLRHFTLQGSTPKPVRAELVRRFNGGEADVFLVSLRAGGTGLNLTAADIVIHYDPWWNQAAQNQATDRAYRIGQNNPVQVYKLIAQDTIEEKILEMQQAKQSLADTVTGSADGAILSMRPDQLLELLEQSTE